MLCEDISWVFRALYFSHFDAGTPHLALQPETLRVYMAQLAQAVTGADPDGGGGIRPHAHREVNAEVAQETLEAESHASGFDCPVILGLAAGQRYLRLGRAPGLHQVVSEHKTSAAGAFAGSRTPCPIGVAVHLNMRGLLPWKFVYKALMFEDVPSQPLECIARQFAW